MSFVNRLRQSEGLAVVYRRVCNARYGRGWGGFHRDPIYRKLIEELIESLQPTAFVETGTYRGYSTEFVASRFPKLPIYTTEIVEDRYQLTKKQLNRYSNITAELGNSDAVVRKWVAERKPGALPLYFLDAHWETYWPLREELRCITGAGGKAVIVIDDSASMVDVLYNCCRFMAHESCGQCTPCREGTSWMTKILERIRSGHGSSRDLDLLQEVAGSMGIIPGTTICGLADGAAWPVKNAIKKFRPEFEAYIAGGKKSESRVPLGAH